MRYQLQLILILALSSAGLLRAGDDEDVKQATRQHFKALNDGDVEAHIIGHAPNRSVFRFDGGPLREFTTLKDQQNELRQMIQAGYKSDQEIRDMKISLYGSTAIVTGHVVGTVTTGGKAIQVNERRTTVLVKQEGRWLEVHQHSSPLVETQPRD